MADAGVTSGRERVDPSGDSALIDDVEFAAALEELAAAPPVDPRSRRPLQPGDVVDGTYRVERMLGAGGMGVVYLATDLALDRPVALKLHLTDPSSHQLERLWREAKVMARLSHPNVVSIYEVGRWQNHLFIAMEYIEGGTAHSWVTARPRSWREVIALYTKAARGLIAAHRAGIIHRDFKPDNILVDTTAPDGSIRPRVADFGLAQPAGHPITWSGVSRPESSSHGDSATTAPSGSQRLTRTGAFVGTRGYMAPEQRGNKGIDERADQFSFCVSLYEALCGTRPFGSSRDWDDGPAPPPEGRSIPPHVWRALQRGLRRNPADRWPSLQDLVDALEHDPSVRRRRWRWSVAAAAGVVGTSWVAYQAGIERPADCSGGTSIIAAVWNDQALTRIARAFGATGSPLASSSTDRLGALLDEYAASWAASHRSVCEATHHHHAQSTAVLDRQTACLQRRKQALAAMVDVLGSATEPEVVEQALDAVRGLDPVEICRTIEATDMRIEPPTLDLADAVETVRRSLDHAAANRLAGRVQQSTKQAREAFRQAEKLGYLPLLAQARYELGSSLSELGKDSAAQELRRAHFDAVTVGDDALAARTATDLVTEVAQHANGPTEALLWYEVARAFHERMGTAPANEATLLAARGVAYLRAEEHDKARSDMEAALPRAGPALRAKLLGNLSTSYQFQADYQKAAELREQALQQSIAVYGSEHPEVANMQEGLAMVYADLGRLEDALKASEQSTEIWRRSVGADSPRLVEALNKRGSLLTMLGDRNGALQVYRKALALLERVDPDNAEGYINLEGNIGSTLMELEHHEEAEAHLQRAASLAAEHLGSGHFKTGILELNVGNLHAMQEEWDAAVEHTERAVEILREAKGVEHPYVATALLSLAGTYMHLPDYEGASRAVDEAARIVEAAFPEPERTRARVASVRARLARETGRYVDAIAELELCIDVFASMGSENHPERVQCFLDLGRSHAALGNEGPAREALEAGLARMNAGATLPSGTAASTRFELARLLPRADRQRAITLATEARDLLAPDDEQRTEIEQWLVRNAP